MYGVPGIASLEEPMLAFEGWTVAGVLAGQNAIYINDRGYDWRFALEDGNRSSERGDL